jgi:hypothetical protein
LWKLRADEFGVVDEAANPGALVMVRKRDAFREDLDRLCRDYKRDAALAASAALPRATASSKPAAARVSVRAI